MFQKCEKCGAVYDLDKQKIAVRDKDSLNCKFCGKKLISWNGSYIYVIDGVIKEPDKTE